MVQAEVSAVQRRVAVRQGSSWEARCQRLDEQSDRQWLYARVHDVSTLGVGLEVPQRVEPGTRLLVELASSEGRLIERFHAEVVNATKERDGWLIGCVFQNVAGSGQA